jgi:Cytochrome c oxidase subunit IV
VKTGIALFVSSALFGLVIATAYWFSSHHAGGTILLALMGTGLAFATLWALVAERDADLSGDDPRLLQSQAAGEDLGIFTSSSAWPILMAACVSVTLAGMVWSLPVLVAGLAGITLVAWRLGAESARAESDR